MAERCEIKTNHVMQWQHQFDFIALKFPINIPNVSRTTWNLIKDTYKPFVQTFSYCVPFNLANSKSDFHFKLIERRENIHETRVIMHLLTKLDIYQIN